MSDDTLPNPAASDLIVSCRGQLFPCPISFTLVQSGLPVGAILETCDVTLRGLTRGIGGSRAAYVTFLVSRVTVALIDADAHVLHDLAVPADHTLTFPLSAADHGPAQAALGSGDTGRVSAYSILTDVDYAPVLDLITISFPAWTTAVDTPTASAA